MSSTSLGGQDVEEQLQERQDELELLIMTLETVAVCLQGTQQCPSKIKVKKPKHLSSATVLVALLHVTDDRQYVMRKLEAAPL